MTKKILLVAYQFCPKGQIGTRRWSKFAKYLSRNGFTVHVLCAKYPYKDQINWCHEVEGDPNIIIHRIPAMYPTYLLRPKRDFWIKLFDRIFSHSLFYLDYAQHWGWTLIPAATKLLKKEDIQTVVVTGGPFSTLYQASKLKSRLPGIKLIMDFRDPWSTWLPKKTWIQKKRKRKAEILEQQCLPKADLVLFTTKQLKATYSTLFPELATRFEVLYNGFDEDDFDMKNSMSSPPMSLVYTGSLIKERLEAVVAIIETLEMLDDPFVHEHLKIHLYGFNYVVPEMKTESLQKRYEKHVEYHGVVSQKEVFEVLGKYDICFSINAKGHEHLIGAKTFDYMGLGKKIFLISKLGELSDILSERGQFVADYDPSSVKEALLKLKDTYSGHEQGSSQKLYKPFNYHELTRQLLTYLQPSDKT